MHTCIHAYIHSYIHTYTHALTHIHTYILTKIHSCVCLCGSLNVWVCLFACNEMLRDSLLLDADVEVDELAVRQLAVLVLVAEC